MNPISPLRSPTISPQSSQATLKGGNHERKKSELAQGTTLVKKDYAKPTGYAAMEIKKSLRERLSEIGHDPIQKVLDSMQDYEDWFSANKDNMDIKEQSDYFKQKMAVSFKLLEYTHSKAVVEHQSTKTQTNIQVNAKAVLEAFEKKTSEESTKIINALESDITRFSK